MEQEFFTLKLGTATLDFLTYLLSLLRDFPKPLTALSSTGHKSDKYNLFFGAYNGRNEVQTEKLPKGTSTMPTLVG